MTNMLLKARMSLRELWVSVLIGLFVGTGMIYFLYNGFIKPIFNKFNSEIQVVTDLLNNL